MCSELMAMWKKGLYWNFSNLSLEFLKHLIDLFILKCKQKLACNIHICDQLCHKPNECPPCMKKSQQPCVCGNKTRERDCNSLIWSCDKVCNKQFECGRHRCKVKCHSGDCGECPNGLPRSCPCGKEVRFLFWKCLKIFI